MEIGGWLHTAFHFCQFLAYLWFLISHTFLLFIYFAEWQHAPVYHCHTPFLKSHFLMVLTVFHRTCAVIEAIFLICQASTAKLTNQIVQVPLQIQKYINILLCCFRIVLFVCDAWNSDLDISSGSYSTAWLSDILLSKLARWSEEKTLNTEVTSLRLVNIERYSQVYNELKLKYGKYFVQVQFSCCS